MMQIALHWLLYVILLVAMVAGMFVTLFGLPGLWFMFLGAAGYMWLTGWAFLGWRSLITLGVIAMAAEVVEFMASSAGAKRAGAQRGGVWGAILGAMVGAIFFTGLIPIPIVGTIFGVCFGAFLGAVVGELTGGREISGSLKVGVGAAKGRLMGTMSKLMFGLAMLLVAVWTALPIHGAAAVPARTPVGSIAPTTLPAPH